MKRPDWEEILEVMYHESPPKWDPKNPTDHPFWKETELEPSEISSILKKLDSWGLVSSILVDGEKAEYDPEADEMTRVIKRYKLSADGFEVAHDRELANRDNQINQSLVFFTFILVITDVIGLVRLSDFWNFVIALILLAGMLYLIGSDNLLS